VGLSAEIYLQELETQNRHLEQLALASDEATEAAAAGISSNNPASKLKALVLYSYDRQEDNEMDLIEGEIVEQIVHLDEGWASGVSQDGTRSGMFPSNFVEMMEGEEQHQQSGKFLP